MPHDGDGDVVIRTEAAERTVRIPSGETQCRAMDVVLLDRLTPGATVEAHGVVGADRSVTPCTEADHYLRRLGAV